MIFDRKLLVRRDQLSSIIKDDQQALYSFEQLFKEMQDIKDQFHVYGTPFSVFGILPSATAATPVDTFQDLGLPLTATLYISFFAASVNGATAWTGAGTEVYITDRTGANKITIPKALLVGNAIVYNTTPTVDMGIMYSFGGFYQKLRFVADANFATGDPIMFTVFGSVREV